MDNAPDIERAILGARILNPEVNEQLKCPVDYFFSQQHQAIAKAIDKVGADLLAIEHHLEKTNQTAVKPIVLDCIADASFNTEYHMEILKEAYLTRKLKSGIRPLLGIDDPYEIAMELQKMTTDVSKQTTMLTPSQIVERDVTTPKAEKLVTFVPTLDTFYQHSHRRGQIEVTIADSGHGKTQYAMWKVWHLLNHYNVLWFQLEGYDTVTAQYFIKHPKRDNLQIADSVYNIEDIKMETMRQNRERGIDYVVIDYVQNLECTRMEKHSAVEYISQQLTRLAIASGTFIQINSQVTLNYHSRTGWKQEPRYGDVRWSQQLKQDAHIITSVFRPSRIDDLIVDQNTVVDYKGQNVPYNSVYVKQAKLRHGEQDWKRIHLIHNDNGLELQTDKNIPF